MNSGCCASGWSPLGSFSRFFFRRSCARPILRSSTRCFFSILLISVARFSCASSFITFSYASQNALLLTR